MAAKTGRILKLRLADDTTYTCLVAANFSLLAAFDDGEEFLTIAGSDGTELLVPKRLITGAELGAKYAAAARKSS